MEVGPYKLKAPFNRTELQLTLSAAIDRQNQIEKLESPESRAAAAPAEKMTGSDKISHWISRHYLAAINLFVLIYIGLPFLAPVLMRAGFETPARVIYRSYRLVCHQLAYRSFFLFGEQAIYPREAARSELDVHHLRSRLERGLQIVEAEIWLPTSPTNWWCSKRWCGYWDICPYGARGRSRPEA